MIQAACYKWMAEQKQPLDPEEIPVVERGKKRLGGGVMALRDLHVCFVWGLGAFLKSLLKIFVQAPKQRDSPFEMALPGRPGDP